ncbi:MAG: hypothetical protein ACOZIN_13375 [Myxococcota bacterium]
MEAHGGYLCRWSEVEASQLVRSAREALSHDGEALEDAALLVSVLPQHRLVRLAYDGPFTYGRKGARWYEKRHALARLLSRVTGLTVHAYVFDPDELEQVTTYGDGREVGGERLRYEDAELPDDEGADFSELSFEKLKSKWPLGHLATVLGVTREELLRLPRARTALLELGPSASICQLDRLPHLERVKVAGEEQEGSRDQSGLPDRPAGGEERSQPFNPHLGLGTLRRGAVDGGPGSAGDDRPLRAVEGP